MKKSPPRIQDILGQIQLQNEQIQFQTFQCLLAELTPSVFQLLLSFCLIINTPKLSREMCVSGGAGTNINKYEFLLSHTSLFNTILRLLNNFLKSRISLRLQKLNFAPHQIHSQRFHSLEFDLHIVEVTGRQSQRLTLA